jgi:hypothetical protein
VFSLDEGPGAAERDGEESDLQVGHAIDLGVIPWADDQQDADDQLEQISNDADRQHLIVLAVVLVAVITVVSVVRGNRSWTRCSSPWC